MSKLSSTTGSQSGVVDGSGTRVKTGLSSSCRCLATKHPCFSNCMKCGFIFCLEDKDLVLQKGCLQCGNVVIPPMSSSGALSLGKTSQMAYALKDKLLQFDREHAKRTQVFDAQADYYETTVWLTEEEKEAIDKQQQTRRDQQKISGRQAFLSVRLDGVKGKGVATQSFRRNNEEANLESEDLRSTDERGYCDSSLDNDGLSVVAHNASLLMNENTCGGVYRLLRKRML